MTFDCQELLLSILDPETTTHTLWWMMDDSGGCGLWWWWWVGEVWERWCAKGWFANEPSTPIYSLNRSLGTAPCPSSFSFFINCSFYALVDHAPVSAGHDPVSAGHDLVCRSVSVLSRFPQILRILELTTAPCPLGTPPWWVIEASTTLSFLQTLGHSPVLIEHGACSAFCLLVFAWEDAVGGSGMPRLFLFLYLC